MSNSQLLNDKIEEVLSEEYQCPVYGRLTLRASRLVHILRAGKEGDYLTDDDLEKIAGVPVDTKSKQAGLLYTAMSYIQREEGIVWKRRRSEGRIYCLNDSEKLSKAIDHLKHVKRTTGRELYSVHSINNEKLDENEKVTHGSVSIQMQLTNELSRSTTTKALSEKVKKSHGELPESKQMLDKLLK